MSDPGKTLILGAGKSGQAAARLLAAEGRGVRLADEKRLPASLPDSLAGIETREGAFESEWLDGVEALVISPGVPPTSPALRAAREAGLPVSGELEEAYRRCDRPIVAVTGSNGKSTVTALTGHLLEAQGLRAPAGGNLGRPLSELLLDEPDAQLYVVEVSSFQAETFDAFHPRAAALLNLSPDHMDRYGGVLADYYAAKLRLFARMDLRDHLIMGEQDEVRRLLANSPARRVPFLLESAPERSADGCYLSRGELRYRFAGVDEAVMPAVDLPLVGRHNVANALAAMALTLPFGADPAKLAEGLRSFRGLPHRMEDLGELDGLRCYNDSKATNVEATLAGLDGLSGSLLLIVGGRDKGSDFHQLANGLPGVRIAFCIGEAGPSLAEAFGERARVLPDLEAALAAARAEGREDELLLLSPACTSYDQYRSFEERGDHFRRLIEEARS